jgi:hypothetical protein
MIFGIWLAVLGILAASNLIIARRPDAREMIGKVAPFQGWIGAISALWGIWGVISCILSLSLLTTHPITWISLVGVSLLLTGLGLLLGVGVLKTFITAPAATEKMDQTIARLAPMQGTLGLVAIGLGIWQVIASVVL